MTLRLGLRPPGSYPGDWTNLKSTGWVHGYVTVLNRYWSRRDTVIERDGNTSGKTGTFGSVPLGRKVLFGLKTRTDRVVNETVKVNPTGSTTQL